MNCTIIKKAKVFFIVALVVLVAGLAIFGIFGFNQTIDYKEGYELQVSVDQKVDKAIDVMKDSADKYLADNGIKSINYATQTLDDGMTVVYKFTYDVTDSVSDMKGAIQSALDEKSGVQGISADVVVRKVSGREITEIGKTLLALGLSVVGVLVYVLIIERLAGALSTVISTLLSAVLYVALVSLTRISVASFVAMGGAISMLLAAGISAATVNKYKKECKKAEKQSKEEIVNKVATNAKSVYIITGVGVLLSALALCAFTMPYLMFAGAQVAIAGISGIASAIFATPVMWCLIKRDKK